MGIYIGQQRLNYLWEKIKNLFATGTAGRAQGIPFGEVDSTSTATAFTATVEGITALEDGVCCYLKNTVETSAAATTAPKCWTLNINNLGAKPVYVTTAAATYSTTHFTKNYKMLFTYDSSLNSDNGGWYIGQLFNSNTTYSDMTQAEIDAGTGTTGRKITPKMLRDNFYTEGEVDDLLDGKADSEDIPTVPTNVSAFTNDAGYITGYTESDPVFAASAAHGITSSDISNWNGKQAAIGDLADIRSGAALGATALQSYTETDPTIPAWAKASTKPSYTAAEVGALPDTTVIPAAPGTLNTTATTAQSTSSSETLSGNITLHKVAKTGTYNDLIGKPTIPTVPTTLSAFTDDLGSSPTHTHSQYLTSAPVTSVNGQTGAVSLTIPTITISSAEPTSSDGNNGDIWIVI